MYPSTWWKILQTTRTKKTCCREWCTWVVMPAWAILICPLGVGSTSSFHGCILGPTSRAGPSYRPIHCPG
ncbi:hypothetical protein BDW42DRAFT_179632 [Aspergillus taichungensis]|uniref:Uncharacterized protein n=1 Tax=Aspergillus taichungensis TaxID=482145 RepID=A0A2J5HGG1_9EURO|nr:hypothetical protein BDW42DRAFT_179632 [Aspergillus taichungensis]